MTISLDELERLAQASSMVLSGSRQRWLDLYYLEHMSMFQCDREFIAACDPATILKLLAVVKAAKRLVTATYTIADTGCFNAADDAVKQAENALSALEAP